MTVIEIVPEDEKLIVEAKLPLSEIVISKGLLAKIKLNHQGSRFRPLNGKVILLEQIKFQFLIKMMKVVSKN